MSAKKLTPGLRIRQHVKAAAEHHSTLNAFAAVVALLEAGVVCDPRANAAAQRIIRICHEEQQRQLHRYDSAITKAAMEPA